MGCSERRKELKRRWKRRKKVAHLTDRASKASVSEKGVIANKLRRLTPGASEIIDRLSLEER